jgi:hypothetical protein
VLIRQLEAWQVNKNPVLNKERTRLSSVNSKIDSKMTPVTPCEVKTLEAKNTRLLVKMLERRPGTMLVGTHLTKIGQ